MATYNGARFLEEQLTSFAQQDRLPDELVVCDDGSTDDTLDILARFAREAPFRVRIERNAENLGYVRNFEKALSLCEGDLIFLSDQDDVWLQRKLAVVEAEFLADAMLMSTINDMYITDEKLNHSGVTQLGNILQAGQPERMFRAGCCIAIRKKALDVLFPFPVEDYPHDAWITEITRSLGVRKVLPVPLQLYRRHGKTETVSYLSEPKSVNILKQASHLNLASPLDGWDIHFHLIGIKQKWVEARRRDLEVMGLGHRVDPFLKELEQEERNIRDRIAILRLPRLMRLPRVLVFWMSGRYQYFTGWKSALKDAIRR